MCFYVQKGKISLQIQKFPSQHSNISLESHYHIIRFSLRGA